MLIFFHSSFLCFKMLKLAFQQRKWIHLSLVLTALLCSTLNKSKVRWPPISRINISTNTPNIDKWFLSLVFKIIHVSRHNLIHIDTLTYIWLYAYVCVCISRLRYTHGCMHEVRLENDVKIAEMYVWIRN